MILMNSLLLSIKKFLRKTKVGETDKVEEIENDNGIKTPENFEFDGSLQNLLDVSGPPQH